MFNLSFSNAYNLDETQVSFNRLLLQTRFYKPEFKTPMQTASKRMRKIRLKNARGKNVTGKNVRGKIARSKNVRAKAVKIP